MSPPSPFLLRSADQTLFDSDWLTYSLNCSFQLGMGETEEEFVLSICRAGLGQLLGDQVLKEMNSIAKKDDMAGYEEGVLFLGEALMGKALGGKLVGPDTNDTLFHEITGDILIDSRRCLNEFRGVLVPKPHPAGVNNQGISVPEINALLFHTSFKVFQGDTF